MRSGDLDKDTQVEDADEKLEMNGEKNVKVTDQSLRSKFTVG